jgi:hypothetical protein
MRVLGVVAACLALDQAAAFLPSFNGRGRVSVASRTAAVQQVWCRGGGRSSYVGLNLAYFDVYRLPGHAPRAACALAAALH